MRDEKCFFESRKHYRPIEKIFQEVSNTRNLSGYKTRMGNISIKELQEMTNKLERKKT